MRVGVKVGRWIGRVRGKLRLLEEIAVGVLLVELLAGLERFTRLLRWGLSF